MGNRGACQELLPVFFSCELPCRSFHNQYAQREMKEFHRLSAPARCVWRPRLVKQTAVAVRPDPAPGSTCDPGVPPGRARPGVQRWAEPVWGNASRGLNSIRTRTVPPKTSHEWHVGRKITKPAAGKPETPPLLGRVQTRLRKNRYPAGTGWAQKQLLSASGIGSQRPPAPPASAPATGAAAPPRPRRSLPGFLRPARQDQPAWPGCGPAAGGGGRARWEETWEGLRLPLQIWWQTRRRHMAIGPSRPALGRWVRGGGPARGGRGEGGLCRGDYRRSPACSTPLVSPQAPSRRPLPALRWAAAAEERRARGSPAGRGGCRGAAFARRWRRRGAAQRRRGSGRPRWRQRRVTGACGGGRRERDDGSATPPPGAGRREPHEGQVPGEGGRRWHPFSRGRAVAAARCPPSGTWGGAVAAAGGVSWARRGAGASSGWERGVCGRANGSDGAPGADLWRRPRAGGVPPAPCHARGLTGSLPVPCVGPAPLTRPGEAGKASRWGRPGGGGESGREPRCGQQGCQDSPRRRGVAPCAGRWEALDLPAEAAVGTLVLRRRATVNLRGASARKSCQSRSQALSEDLSDKSLFFWMGSTAKRKRRLFRNAGVFMLLRKCFDLVVCLELSNAGNARLFARHWM